MQSRAEDIVDFLILFTECPTFRPHTHFVPPKFSGTFRPLITQLLLRRAKCSNNAMSDEMSEGQNV